MNVTVAHPGPRVTRDGPRPPKVVADLDAALFEPHRWFVIDEHNDRVPGVVVPSLEAGLRLIGQGDVRTVVGRVRAGVRVIDVDLVGLRGHAATESVARWCRSKELWHLVRPSGGADGRSHVFVVPEGFSADLDVFLEQLRTTLRTSSRGIDPRPTGQVRPLSAPHRLGEFTRPLGDLTAARAELRGRLAVVDGTPAPRRRAATSTATALTPRRRQRRDLDDSWTTYLRTGVPPALGGADNSRSTVELNATAALLRAGHTADSAWTLITASHPNAMTRAKSSRRRWISWVWNHEVRQDNERQQRPHISPTAEAAHAARSRLWALQWALSPRQRASVLLVGHLILDRIERTGSLRVPVPERDLVLDTGLRDRKCIRAALRLLDGPLGVLHTDTLDVAKPDSSSFEFEIPGTSPPSTDRLQVQGLREIPPPSSHTPLPAGLWGTLPRAAHSLWRMLPPEGPGPQLTQLCQLAGLTDTPDQEPTPSQRRTATSALHALAAAGLAACDASASWTRAAAPTEAAVGAATTLYEELDRSVTAERTAYRTTGTSSWHLGRTRALTRNQARHESWWHALDPAERTRRRTDWTARFQSLGVLERERVKTDLAERRRRAGVSEAARHDQWIRGHHADLYRDRVIERQRWFETLAPPLQQAYASSWQRHRDRFGIPRAVVSLEPGREHVALLPSGAAQRDQDFLTAQLDHPDQLPIELAG